MTRNESISDLVERLYLNHSKYTNIVKIPSLHAYFLGFQVYHAKWTEYDKKKLETASNP